MNNADVRKQYEKLLKTADDIAELNNKEELTDEDVDKIIEYLDSDPMQNLPSNNGQIYNENTDPSQNVTRQVLVSANPTTGILNSIPFDNPHITEESVEDLINLDAQDFKKIEIGWDAYVENVSTMYPDIDEESLKVLLNVVNKYRQGIKFPYFNELPDIIKNEINSYVNVGAGQNNISINNIRQIKNELAKELFENIISNNYYSKALKDITTHSNTEINKAKEDLEKSVVNYNDRLREQYEINFIDRAKELESSIESMESDEEKEKAKNTAQNLRKASRMYTQSYTLEDMTESFKCGKIKVKPIQIDKFKKTCQDFNRKYYNIANLKINDVGMTVPVLDRVLDEKYDLKTIQKFIVCFINFTRLYSPSNIDEHVFMYQFIQNILALDINIPNAGYSEFNKIVKENIEKFLDIIIEKENK